MAMEAQAQQQAIQASSLTAQADQGTADQKQKTNQ